MELFENLLYIAFIIFSIAAAYAVAVLLVMGVLLKYLKKHFW